jgi:4-hydroxy-2-oxoheptanedioate aldolase
MAWIDNRAKRKLEAGGSVLAITINFVHDGLAEFLGNLGYDVIIVDGEHGAVDDKDVEGFARACNLTGAPPLVRLPFDEHRIERYLGLGIHGFHMARVENASIAHKIVDAVKFGPVGNRGLGNFRAVDFSLKPGKWPAYIERANANTMIKVAVVDPQSIAALPEIVKIPEIDVIFVGRYDLSAAMGFPGETTHPKVTEAYDNAIDLILKAGKNVGMGARTPADMKAAHARGFRYFLTSVSRTFPQGANVLLEAIRELN